MDGQKKEVNWKEKYEEVMAEKKTFEECYQSAVIRMHVKLEARAFGMIDPELAVKLVDVSGCRMDENTDEVYGVHEVILDLAARKPYLFATQIKQGIPPPPKKEDGFLALVQKELSFKKS